MGTSALTLIGNATGTMIAAITAMREIAVSHHYSKLISSKLKSSSRDCQFYSITIKCGNLISGSFKSDTSELKLVLKCFNFDVGNFFVFLVIYGPSLDRLTSSATLRDPKSVTRHFVAFTKSDIQ